MTDTTILITYTELCEYRDSLPKKPAKHRRRPVRIYPWHTGEEATKILKKCLERTLWED